MSYPDNKLEKEVSIPYPLYQSEKGNYFIGQTPTLTAQDKQALVSLINPITSNINIYVNAITITNIGQSSFSAQFYLKSTLTGGTVSNFVSSTNTAIAPEPIPKGQIQYLSTTTQPPNGGVAIFSRIVSPDSTLIIDGGQIILGPGQSLAVFLGGFLPVEPNSAIVAFGWWEERIHNCHC
ncbi:DUF6143 family protein [Romboutsia sedimentorum]|uniref:DUF6143 family protein n=1 Tax=Romboutsia sedimentorum TaxID=1368474 RepID=UPI0024DEB92C|nr:DUF6143 family protein [Romboutsia sedimentorum]MDK2585382.1 DUF6143 family protein [Romboutsia sedimentorum]